MVPGDVQPYLINLIDSPGHVDFSNEASAAIRLSDGALVLVDVLEGICVQTIAVLQQAWSEGVKACLVINKVDRLITELKMEPLEAYEHIKRLLERINSITASFLVSEAMDQADSVALDMEKIKASEKALHFSPSQGNVAFCSAFDKWAFNISTMARFWHEKLGMKKKVLKKVLWGDFYYHAKSKNVYKKPKGKHSRPMFVQFVLEPLWHIYEHTVVEHNAQAFKKIVKSIGIKIPSRELNSKDVKVKLSAVMSRWMPVAGAVLDMVVSKLPSPIESQTERVDRLLDPNDTSPEVLKATQACDKDSPVVLAYIAKMITLKAAVLQKAIEGVVERPKFVRKAYVRGKYTDAGDASLQVEGQEDEKAEPTPEPAAPEDEKQDGPAPGEPSPPPAFRVV